MDDLEVYLEIMPRETGSWKLDRDKLPLQRCVIRRLERAKHEVNLIGIQSQGGVETPHQRVPIHTTWLHRCDL